MKEEESYRSWNIDYWPKPIPNRHFDYSAAHEDYDGEDDPRIVHAESREGIEQAIDEFIAEQE